MLEFFKKFDCLVVDDYEDALTLYENMFSKIFREVYTAKDGIEGIEILKKEKIDVIFTDYNMPKIDGLTFAKKAREIDPNIPIVLITAYSENISLLQEALKININGFLVKPFSFEELKNILENVIKHIIYMKLTLSEQKMYIEYNDYQQKVTTKKQQKLLIKEDLEFFNIDIVFTAKDILSGDGYLIKKGDYIFLVDSMGKGLSASLTTALTLAFINYLIEEKLDFKTILDKFLKFISNILLDDEIISFTIMKIDKENILYASFGMPAMIAINEEVVKLPSNNPPFTSYKKEHKISKIKNNFDTIILFSDGVSEGLFRKGIYIYHKKDLVKDKDAFIKYVLENAEKDDDITIIYLRRKK